MSKRTKNGKSRVPDDGELWVAPRYSLKGPAGERAWENRPGGAPHSSRLLELADIALGLKKPSGKSRHPRQIHQTTKTEPYTQK